MEDAGDVSGGRVQIAIKWSPEEMTMTARERFGMLNQHLRFIVFDDFDEGRLENSEVRHLQFRVAMVPQDEEASAKSALISVNEVSRQWRRKEKPESTLEMAEAITAEEWSEAWAEGEKCI
jgi:hypothetical protein